MADIKTEAISLSNFMAGIVNAVKSVPTQWVRIEIAQLTDKANSTIYIDGVEHDEHGKEIAKCALRIWAKARGPIETKFKQATQGKLETGMKVLVLLRPSFHAQFGFAASIEDIDPSFTLGDMQRKMNMIRQTLIAEGIFESNKRYPEPKDFTSVCVIAPDAAAGLGDFQEVSNRLQGFELCNFYTRAALFQGVEAPNQIIALLERIIQSIAKGNEFDAVVILRGGGAVTDLAWLNDLELARKICLMPIPVFTAIGHERDRTMLDEVSNRSFDTPSKAAKHIEATIIRNAERAENHWQQIIERAQSRLRHVEQRAENLRNQAFVSAEQLLRTAKTSISQNKTLFLRDAQYAIEKTAASVRNGAYDLAGSAIGKLATVEAAANQNKALLLSAPFVLLEQTQKTINTAQCVLHEQPLRQLNQTETGLRRMAGLLIGLGPSATMRRGFALVRDKQGVLITKITNLPTDESFSIEMSDGVTTVRKSN